MSLLTSFRLALARITKNTARDIYIPQRTITTTTNTMANAQSAAGQAISEVSKREGKFSEKLVFALKLQIQLVFDLLDSIECTPSAKQCWPKETNLRFPR